ncbi:MAG: Cof-type HAD-IIB family hydrolase [Zhaonellaceae bacterium]|nr:HAD family phosphatase [Clostridia bacterium]
MPDIKLVAIDLDGTLLKNDLTISPRAEEAIKAATAKGVYVTICTGRMYASALPYVKQLKMELPIITYNGAFVKHSTTGEVLYEKLLPCEMAKDIYLRAKKYKLHSNIYRDDRLYVDSFNKWADNYAIKVGVDLNIVDNMLDFLQRDPIKIVTIAEPQALKILEEELVEVYGDRLYITSSLPHLLEILHPKATKGRGLEAVAEYLGVPRECVMAIGDSYNDMEMFSYAGFSVVMGNGEEDVKKCADYVTCSNDDDGVAEAIEKFVL